ncbi:MAG: folylpolyglutamate synthase/dihydrofolate synthase family protein [Gemmataceae bacterium]
MTYDEALAFWYGRTDFERRAPEAGELKLDRMRDLLSRLGDPHEKLKTVHVTGSKGKGSTCAMLDSVLRHAGYRVGLFTSPHLTDVRERIQVDGALIPKEDVAALLTEMRPAIDAMAAAGNSPTFFEVATALGFVYFLRRACDIAVIEVGLGGRFDSTNVITPLVSVITSVSLDHTQFLGDTVDKIAFEKAGIIKPGVPVVVASIDDGALGKIIVIAHRLRSEVVLALPLPVTPGRVSRDGEVVWPVLGNASPPVTLRLLGPHQAQNAAVVLKCVRLLQSGGFAIGDQDVRSGFANVSWPGRMEVFRIRPVTVIDCAHNVASAQALADTLVESFAHSRRSLVFAVSSDKDVPGILRVLAPYFAHFYLTRYGNNPRAAAPEELAKLLPAGPGRSVHATPTDAWRAACADATPETLVVIAGSVFLAGELRPLLVEAARS